MPNIFINGYCREWQECSSPTGVIIEDCFDIRKSPRKGLKVGEFIPASGSCTD